TNGCGLRGSHMGRTSVLPSISTRPRRPLFMCISRMAGAMRFHHVTGEHVARMTIEREPVLAGAVRVAPSAPATHSVEYRGDTPAEYVRIELRTEPLDRPVRDVRLPPVAPDPGKSGTQTQFESGQVRIIHVDCAEGQRCPQSGHASDPAV